MRIDHIGYAVKNIDKAISSMEALGYSFKPVVEDADRNIYISFGELDGYKVELVSPRGMGISPIDTVLLKNGSTPYHICYRSKTIEEDIACLEKNNFKVIVPLASAIAFDYKRVAFMYSTSVGLIEIVEEEHSRRPLE